MKLLLVHPQAGRLAASPAFSRGFDITTATTVDQGRQLFRDSIPDALLVNRSMEGASFMEEVQESGFKGRIIAIATPPEINNKLHSGIVTIGILRVQLMVDLLRENMTSAA